MAQSKHTHPSHRRKRHKLDFTGASVLRCPGAAPRRAPLMFRLPSLLGLLVVAIALVNFTAA